MKQYASALRPLSFNPLSRSLALCALATLLAGCPAQKESSTSQTAPPAPAAPENKTTVVVRGSNTIGEDLAPRLIAEYKKDHADVDFDTEFKGTGYGLGALSSDKCDIAAASRTVSTNEMDLLKDNNVDLNENVIGMYAVVVVVNPSNSVSGLTKEQVQGIFTGAIQNWKDVGGPDSPIHLYIRNPVSGTYLGFQELALGNQPYGHPEKAPVSYSDIVLEVARDSAGIGYSCPIPPGAAPIKVLAIGGVDPTAENISHGSYPYARTLRFYTNKGRNVPAANDFIEFALSSKGQAVLAQAGFVPRQ